MTMTPTITDSELLEGGMHPVHINGWPILLCRSEQAVWAVINRCSHQASPLADGRLRRGIIMCPLHGGRFDLSSGRCLAGGYAPLRVFETCVKDGVLHVDVPDDAPPPEWQPASGAVT